MPFAPIMPRRRRIAKCLGFVAVGVVAAGGIHPARADRIQLRGGGEIRGKLMDDPDHKGRLLLFGLKGKTPITFRPDQITGTVPEASPLDDYVGRRARPRDTAQAEFDLGVWCEEQKLTDLATAHFEAAARRDPEFVPAQEKLGRTLVNGKWLDADGLREAQGMVRFQGRWVTPEERDRREAASAVNNEGRTWTRRVGKLLDSYRKGPERLTRVAEETLLEIREPAAVGPIVQVLGGDSEPVIRALAARVLGGIPGPEASVGLVNRLLAETDDATRQATMAEIARRERGQVLPALAKGLQSNRVEVLNRAAWGIGALNAVAMVPRLVNALVSTEYDTVTVPGVAPVNGGMPPGFIIGGGPSIPITTPAVVGPGAVAFGATSIPASALGGFGVSIGGGGGPPPPETRIVSYERQNIEVLAALTKLTGRDFGYDVASWRNWVKTSFRPEPEGPAPRRVPQP